MYLGARITLARDNFIAKTVDLTPDTGTKRCRAGSRRLLDDDNFASAGPHVMANKGETGFDGLLYNVLQ